MEYTQENIRKYFDVLNEFKSYYELDGVEITEEDAANVIGLINGGKTDGAAIHEILMGICGLLADGFEM